MATQKEDAESIAGKENAEELDELEKAANLVDKSEAVVERAEEDEKEVKEEIVEDENIETPEEETAELEVADPLVEDVEPETEEIPAQEMSKKLDQIKELLVPTSEPHVLDTVFEALRSEYDEVIETDLTPEEKLQLLQPLFVGIGDLLRSSVSVVSEEVAQQAASDVITRAELKELITPLTEQVSLLVAQMEGGASAETVRTATSQKRRSISEQDLKLAPPEDEKPMQIAAIAKRSVGITSY